LLHYPSEREFLNELRSQRYDYIGINFGVATFHKVKRMVELIRKHAPDAQIALGGYGNYVPKSIGVDISRGTSLCLFFSVLSVSLGLEPITALPNS
jgi:hypothetical protein